MFSKLRSWWWTLVHWAIIITFAQEFVYAAYQVFVVFAPAGGGVLGSAARNFPMELMVPRRLYAIEAWISFSGLGLYIGLTEILPRRLNPARKEVRDAL